MNASLWFRSIFVTSMIYRAILQTNTPPKLQVSPHVNYLRAGQVPWHVCIMHQNFPREGAIIVTVRSVIGTCLAFAKANKNMTMLGGLKSWKDHSVIGGSSSCNVKTASYFQRRNIAYWRVHPSCLRRSHFSTPKFPNLGICFLTQDFIVTPILRPIKSGDIYSLDWAKYNTQLESIFKNPDKHKCTGISTLSVVVPENYRERFPKDASEYSSVRIYSGDECLKDVCTTKANDINPQCQKDFGNFNGFCAILPPKVHCVSKAPAVVMCDGALVGMFASHLCNNPNPSVNKTILYTRLDNLSPDMWTEFWRGQRSNL